MQEHKDPESAKDIKRELLRNSMAQYTYYGYFVVKGTKVEKDRALDKMVPLKREIEELKKLFSPEEAKIIELESRRELVRIVTDIMKEKGDSEDEIIKFGVKVEKWMKGEE